MSGPRQTGKTTLAKSIQKTFSNTEYFNWDVLTHKRKLIESPYFFQNVNRTDNTQPLVILDEIHKYKDWKNYLKGVYDEFAGDFKFLITGSGRLDTFVKGGDSLAGRYFMLHLFPFTVSELALNKRRDANDWMTELDINDASETGRIWSNLFITGGFPEPFINGSESFFNRWTNTYIRQIIKEDVRSFSDVRNIETLELMYSLMPSKVGSPLSVNSLAGDLQVSFDTVKSWLLLLEKIFLSFRLTPWTKKITRAITKECKWYLYNYAEIDEPAMRFENMVAMELMRSIKLWNETGAGSYSLHYIRNKEKHEVDFLIAKKNEPQVIIEAKLSDTAASKNLLEFQNVLGVPAIQLVNQDNVYKKIKNGAHPLLITTAHSWLGSL